MKQKMKHLQSLVAVALCVIFALSFSSCSKDDDEPDSSKSGMMGLWYDGEDSEEEEIYDLLVTKEVWLWNPSVATLEPYKTSSYKELADRFAPDDEFQIYRYDSKNDVYLMYESTSENWDDKNAKVLYNAKEFAVAKIKVSDNAMDITWYSYVDNPDYEAVGYDEARFSYEEIMNNPQFGSLPNGVVLDNPEYITYKRYK